MKLLHVIPSLDPRGGGPMEGLIQMARTHSRNGDSVEVVCFDEPSSPHFEGLPLKAHGLGRGRLGYAYNPHLVPWLMANVDRFDAVVIDGIWQYHAFAAWRVLRKSRVPYFVYTHGMLDPWFKQAYPLKHLKKWLYWPWAEYRVLRDARRVIFTCEDEKLLARQSFWLYQAREAVTSYGTSSPPANAAELKEEFLASHPLLRGRKLLLFLSRIQEKKGCDLLIEAFSKIASKDPNLQLVMAGPDQSGWQSKLQAQAASLGIADRITWTGMLQGNLKWGAFYASDVFCLSSHQENFGIVVAEALACGKPVVISNKVNIWREIEADNAGFIDSDTVEGTLRNLERWLALSPDEYSAMCARAVATFNRRFHIDQAANRLLEIIREAKQ